ncbi:hypothetical protein C453_17354 [Haloferax elongans ATCC BAA-1513]|uniref:Uncharacterized protein n=1 Tax=Haloferax elongans ATCC BAA-1513 TaxID=1230453 RepID=M0HBD2_HALEO|nr:hypothetical protein [Haloferax elongans]ELZ81805.1 hypothetical protein C453_17354 [Haloferax elongans ATCC BAA-1513]
MERRRFLASATSVGALLTAGCLGGSSPSGSEKTETSETTTAEPAPVPESDISFMLESGVLRAVHMGGDKIKSSHTSEVYVTVDGERATTWVADEKETQPYPVSVGNFVEIESAESGSTVEVVWVGRAGTEEVLATHEVGTPTPEATTATNETTTANETATETATNETVTSTETTAVNETATSTNTTATTTANTTTTSTNTTTTATNESTTTTDN